MVRTKVSEEKNDLAPGTGGTRWRRAISGNTTPCRITGVTLHTLVILHGVVSPDDWSLIADRSCEGMGVDSEKLIV